MCKPRLWETDIPLFHGSLVAGSFSSGTVKAVVHAAQGENGKQEAQKLRVLGPQVVERNLVYSLKLVVECGNVYDASQTCGAGEGVEAESSGHVLGRQFGICRHGRERRVGVHRGRVGVEERGQLVGPGEKGRGVGGGGAEQTAKLLLKLLEKDDARGVAVKVPVSAIVEVELAERVDHGHELGLGGGWLGYWDGALHLAGGLYSRLLAILKLGLDVGIHVGVGQVHVGHVFAQEGLGPVQTAF